MTHPHNIRDEAYELYPVQCAVVDKLTDSFKLRVLYNDHVDPLMKEFIQERIESL